MAQVHLICGKICSGKTYFARKLRAQCGGVILSTDEITLALPQDAIRDCFDEVSAGVNGYLLRKTLEIIAAGADVILDWGFWSAKDRADVVKFCSQNGAAYTMYYIDVDEDSLAANISARNAEVSRGETTAFYVDEGLARKCHQRFEIPGRDEVDVWIENRRM